jgi:sugar lactone lactonase YvrE
MNIFRVERRVGAIVLAASLTLIQRAASAQVVTTFAGSGASGSADGRGTAASFSGPRGLAVDPAGVFYVADTDNLKIRRITSDGVVTTFAGDGHASYQDGPAEKAGFYGPLGVTLDRYGNVWVADSDDGIGDGQYLKMISTQRYVLNLILYPGGTPAALAFDGQGGLYVSDLYEGVWKIRADLKAYSRISSNVSQGLAVDGGKNAYVARANRIERIAPDGAVTILAGSGNPGSDDGTGEAASFRDPAGLAIDASGNVYVADRGNHAIRKITPAGTVTTLAGSGSPGKSDGTGRAASFDSPTGVAVDLFGNVYVADTGNNLIRRISEAVSCAGDSTILCLNKEHPFLVSLSARDQRTGRTASGLAVPVNDIFGYFTIPDLTFNSQSPEVLIKIVDGRGLNGSFWVFHGGLTDLEYTLTVEEVDSGRIRTYFKEALSLCGGFDTSAF